MIAITVSTNYSDLIPFIISANERFFTHWYWVTDANDQLTIDAIPKNNRHSILYWDFKNNGRRFDKGGALKFAQQHAYKQFPEDWYLILDSDIALYPNFNVNTDLLDPEKLYGISHRLAFYSKRAYETNQPDQIIPGLGHPIGFFQLYKKKFLYADSDSAGGVDSDFTILWSKTGQTEMLKDYPSCRHLGRTDHWTGRIPGSDFII
jgi:hypothetical protein